jgi:thiamine pyrophosphate-dependent acetolactate synthase large subunit-like protein
MNGVESLVRTLVGVGVDICFANPGTSGMHLSRRSTGSRACAACSVAADGAAAIAAARVPPGQIATLILPADTAWNEGSSPDHPRNPAPHRSSGGIGFD